MRNLNGDDLMLWITAIFLLFALPFMAFSADVGVAGIASQHRIDRSGVVLQNNTATVELRTAYHSPSWWIAYAYQGLGPIAGQREVNEKTVLLGIEVQHTVLRYRLEGSLHRIEIGPMQRFIKPYFVYEQFTNSLDAVLETKEKTTFSSQSATKLLAGGGVRLESWKYPVLVYADVSVLNGHQRYQTGLRNHWRSSYFGLGYRYDKFDIPDIKMTSSSPFVEVGCAW